MSNTADNSVADKNGLDKNGQLNSKNTKASKDAKTQQVEQEYTPVKVDIKSLMAAGAHFGHQTPRWNPKMTKYIYGERNGIHILNLDYTLEHWEKAVKFVRDIVSRGGEVLIVGTKPQAQRVVREAAQRSGAHYVVSRWLGGTLSNFQTIKNSIQRMTK
ncbi:MAG: 30S ribosomal protein S2, partial [Bdellovibrionales bacterium]|nr:30S ribosomal protein S2 [Bdellovibrionales bacterium]